MGLLRRLRRLVAGIARRLPFSKEVKGLLHCIITHLRSLNPNQLHDVLNLVAIGLINVVNLVHLTLGKGFNVLTSACLSYFIADIGYIAAFPQSAKNAAVIIMHHIVSAMYVMVPICFPQFRHFMSMCLLVEINTWLQIARKTFPHHLLQASFYASWVSIRLLYFPWLIPQFFSLWLKSVDSDGNRHPLLLMAWVFQVMLSSLNYYWTVELLVNVSNRRKRAAVRAKSKAASQEPVVNVSAE